MSSKNLISAWLTLLCFSAAAKSPLEISIQPGRGEIEARFKGQKIFVYAFSTNQLKPYVRELYTLRGDNILRDSPPDHLHHHGLMYAICINGTNFWEEKDAPGCEKSIELLAHNVGKNPSGLPQASFTQLIHWVAPQNKDLADTKSAALLIERRTITLTVDEAREEVAVQWRADFQVGPATKTATLQGTIYHGLGLRLPLSFDHVAQFQNPQKENFSEEKNHQALPAPWTSVSGKIDGREITAALFSKSSNAGESRIFAMADPFCYLSATQNLIEKPLAYSAGDKFSLDYLLTVYPTKKSSNFLQQRFQNWEQKKK